MKAIIDSRISTSIKSSLNNLCSDILFFESHGITYNSISGHPDIFIYHNQKETVVAPNSPKLLVDFLKKNLIQYSIGNYEVGKTLKQSTLYNCISTNKYFFHKTGFTDKVITEKTKDKHFISLPQAYTACSLIALDDNNYVTSDKGIEKVLLKNGFNCLYFIPDDITIFDHKNGFIGGTCGIFENKILFAGNIQKHKSGNSLKDFLENLKLEIICLSNDFLYDAGKIILF